MSLTYDILQFWFGEIQNGLSPEEKNALWYGGGPEIDTQIRHKYADTLHEFKGESLPEWVSSDREQLAAIILTDQFSRNIYRGQREAFAFDKAALAICLKGIEQGTDKRLSLVERVFFYHPLEHSENLDNQSLCVAIASELLQETKADKGFSDAVIQKRVSFAENALNYIILHRDIIAKFGRFPHRNETLGREPTIEEVKWLQEGGNRFGQ